MNFSDTIKNITTFYEKFDITFKRIDDLFQESTDVGGRNDDSINAVVCTLMEFQLACYKNVCLSKETPQEYLNLDRRIKELSDEHNELDGYVNFIKDLQYVVRNSLINDTDWQGQQLCIEIISTLLKKFSLIESCPDDKINSYYAAVRILRELVADCSITICALQPLSKWNYGTGEYAELSAEEQLLVLLNQAILIDRMYFCLYSLEIILERLDRLINSFQKLDVDVYYVAGFLNFKIHKYNNAREYFLKVVYNSKNDKLYTDEEDNLYFRSMLFIAYSYEYSGEFGLAIEQLVNTPDVIDNIVKGYSLSKINTDINEIMDRICETASLNSLIKLYIPSFSDFCQRAMKNKKNNLEKQFEILHALAHCLNEYAIKYKKVTSEYGNSTDMSINVGKLLCLARSIMHVLAEYKIEYLTCYATIHGEYRDYHQALIELGVAEKAYLKQKKFHGKETLEAEVKFFKYYFGLLCNQVFEDDKKQFENYYNKYNDDDAECYLKIFEFRNELRKYLAILYSDVRNAEDTFSEQNLTPISNELSKKYKGLCKLNPTLYMNVNVRAELRLMQRAYICICKLREYLIFPTPEKLLDLRNASYRFLCVKRDFSLTSNECDNFVNVNLPQDEDYDDYKLINDYEELPQIVSQAFSSGKASVLDCLFNTDSIFILAPISDVVVFQYQTGTISKLFDLEERMIFPLLDNAKHSTVEEVANMLFDIYSEMSAHYDQRKLANIDWSKLKKYASVIYYWESDISSQVIVTKVEAPSYTRQIVDNKKFLEKMHSIKSDFEKKKRKKCTDQVKYHNVRCTVQFADFSWFEIINENEETKKYAIIWDESNNSKCFIIPSSIEMEKNIHSVHSIIRNITIEYDSVETVTDLIMDEVNETNYLETISDPNDIHVDNKMLMELCIDFRMQIDIKRKGIVNNLESCKRRIEYFGEDISNENCQILIQEKTKLEEQLRSVYEIEQRLNNEYKDSTIEQLKKDYDYLLQ